MCNLLFIQAIEAGDWDSLKIKCIPFAIVAIASTVAMIIDLIGGVRKAKQRGEYRTSDGYKRTVDKALRYYSLMLLCFLMDVVCSLFYQIPFFTLLSGAGVIAIEIKSWYERADQKEKKAIDLMAEMMKNKDDIIKAVGEQLSKK